jgi:hypothetical protein
MVLAGFFRVILRGERLNRRLNGLDRLILVWAGWLLTSSLFHKDVSGALAYRLGLVYDVCGIYFLVCVFCKSIEDLVHLYKMTAIILVPVALAMLYEKITAYNLFSMVGGVDEMSYIRAGKVRAGGPFGHAILAGTVGAVCLPTVVSLMKLNRKVALTGTAACLAMIYASTSSGPILSTLAGVFALLMWRFREKTSSFFWLMVLAYIALDIVMLDPAYYIMARIDLAGGSTGWYRARLIESSIEHLSEWWLVGTDYTRHWMSTGLDAFPDQSDITNHYIKFGVLGGLPLMLIFIAQIVKGFLYVGKTVRYCFDSSLQIDYLFVVWSFGATLFAHAVTCISISYFDQSGIFLYVTLAGISSIYSEAFVIDKVGQVGTVQKAVDN